MVEGDFAEEEDIVSYIRGHSSTMFRFFKLRTLTVKVKVNGRGTGADHRRIEQLSRGVRVPNVTGREHLI